MKEHVAHYTSSNTFMEYILPTQQIKLGKIDAMNDPYESSMQWTNLRASSYKS